MGKKIGIDLGTANTMIYVEGKGIVLRAPSGVAVDKHTKKVVAVGLEAKRMIGKTPGFITAYRPLKDGVISDFDIRQTMIRKIILKNAKKSVFLFESSKIGQKMTYTLCRKEDVTEIIIADKDLS